MGRERRKVEAVAWVRPELAKYFAMEFLSAGPLNRPIQGDLETSCSPILGVWGAFEGSFPTSLLRNVDFTIGINFGDESDSRWCVTLRDDTPYGKEALKKATVNLRK
jgi:hypothetical protein